MEACSVRWGDNRVSLMAVFKGNALKISMFLFIIFNVDAYFSANYKKEDEKAYLNIVDRPLKIRGGKNVDA